MATVALALAAGLVAAVQLAGDPADTACDQCPTGPAWQEGDEDLRRLPATTDQTPTEASHP